MWFKKLNAGWALSILFTSMIFFGLSPEANGQGVLDRLEKKVEKKVESRVNRKVDRAIDKNLDKAEDKVDNAASKKKKDKKNKDKSSSTADNSDSKKDDNSGNSADPKSSDDDGKSKAIASNGNKKKKVNMFAAQAAAASEGADGAADIKTELKRTQATASMGAGPQPDEKAPQTDPPGKTDPPVAGNSNTKTSNEGPSGAQTAAASGQGKDDKPVTESELQKDNRPSHSGKSSIKAMLGWSEYDFVPGELVIFADNQAKAKDGEFPTDFSLLRGSAEYSGKGQEKAITFLGIPTEIAPKMKTEAFLPQSFTLEFDAYFHGNEEESYVLKFKGMDDIEARLNSVAMGEFNGYTVDNVQDAKWRHIAVTFNSKGMKMYIDQYRVVNIPKVEKRPSSFTIYAANSGARTGNRSQIKNFRLFDGSLNPMDRFERDGRLITRGITFRAGSSELNPESAGTLNMIAEILRNDPAMNVNIEVHVDKTGAPSSELQELTSARADVVKDALVSRGITPARLHTKGWGDFKPVDSNDTAAGRENNRRVEFIKH